MRNLIAMSLLCVLPVSVMAASPKLDSNELLYQYCDTEHAEFEQSVTVGQGTKVLYHQGPFMQITASTSNQAVIELVRDKLEQVSESAQCAQYLLSRATVVDNNPHNQVIARVLFDFDKDELNKQSRYLLLQLAARLEQQATDLVITGNTDSKGSDEYNLSLGLQRSKAVLDYLQAQGVDVNQATVTSQGEHAPVQTNDSESGRHDNRRTDIHS